MRVRSALAAALCVLPVLGSPGASAPAAAPRLGPAWGALFGGDYRTAPHFWSGAVVAAAGCDGCSPA